MWPFLGFMGVYGILCFVFAFVEPPGAISGLFKVPAVFVFLPDRYVVRVGRIFMGILCLGLVGFFAIKFSAVPVP